MDYNVFSYRLGNSKKNEIRNERFNPMNTQKRKGLFPDYEKLR